MISWVQRNFQQHFRIIFALVLVGTVISFVWSIGATSSIGYNNRESIARDYFGHNLGSSTDIDQLMRDGAISIQFQSGYNSLDQDQLKTYALRRVAALHLADELRLPAPNSDQLTQYIRSLRIFADQTSGQFDANRYNVFRNSLTAKAGSSDTAVVRVITEDVRINEVGRLLSGPGYVLTEDVNRALASGDTSWTVATATLDYASFNPEIHPTDADLQKFFTENSFRYDIPPRVLASYVDFPAADYLGAVTVDESELRSYYDANPAQFAPAPPAGGSDKSLSPKPRPDFQAVRAQVEAAVKLKQAQRLALDAASKFALGLYDNKVPAGPALDAYLADSKLTAKPLAPFTHEAGPAEFSGSPEIAAAAFKLGADRYFSEELATPTGAAVLLWRDTQPTRKPLFIEVRSKVLADYADNEKHILFSELGKTLRTQIANGLKFGLTFDEAAKRAAGSTVKVETKSFPAFKLVDRPKDVDDALVGALEALEKGQVSELIATEDKGRLVYVVDKKAPSLSADNPHSAEIRAQLAAYTARLGTSSYLAEIVDRELKRSAAVAK